MFSSYKRVISFFQNTAMEAKGTPGPDELKLLEPLRGKISHAVFGEAYVPPVTDGSGNDRTLLKQANDLLLAAGCKRDGAACSCRAASLSRSNSSTVQRRFAAASVAVHREHEEARHRGATSRIVDPAQYKAARRL